MSKEPKLSLDDLKQKHDKIQRFLAESLKNLDVRLEMFRDIGLGDVIEFAIEEKGMMRKEYGEFVGIRDYREKPYEATVFIDVKGRIVRIPAKNIICKKDTSP